MRDPEIRRNYYKVMSEFESASGESPVVLRKYVGDNLVCTLRDIIRGLRVRGAFNGDYLVRDNTPPTIAIYLRDPAMLSNLINTASPETVENGDTLLLEGVRGKFIISPYMEDYAIITTKLNQVTVNPFTSEVTVIYPWLMGVIKEMNR